MFKLYKEKPTGINNRKAALDFSIKEWKPVNKF